VLWSLVRTTVSAFFDAKAPQINKGINLRSAVERG
jgi:hypothetical protein